MKKNLLAMLLFVTATLECLAAGPLDANKKYWMMDVNWSYIGYFPATEGETSVTYVVARLGNMDIKSGNGSTKFPTNSIISTAADKGSTGQCKSIDKKPGIYKLTLTYSTAAVTREFATALDVSISGAGVSTLVAPANLTIPSGVKVYTLKYEGGSTLKGMEITTTIPANTPVLINGAEGTYSFPIVEGTTDIHTSTYNYKDGNTDKTRDYMIDVTTEDNVLYGVMQYHYVPENSYVLQNGASGIGFYKVNVANYAINAFRCYVTLPAAVEAHSLSIVFDDDVTTGIADVRGQKEDGRSDIFNLSGQRVGKDYKGVVIKNGRKMIQK